MTPTVVGVDSCAVLGTTIEGTRVSEAEGTLLRHTRRAGKIGVRFVVSVITAAIMYFIADRPTADSGLNKPTSIISPGPIPIDPTEYYRDIGLKAYMIHNYGEYNRILTCLQVCKVATNIETSILQFRADVDIGQYQLL